MKFFKPSQTILKDPRNAVLVYRPEAFSLGKDKIEGRQVRATPLDGPGRAHKLGGFQNNTITLALAANPREAGERLNFNPAEVNMSGTPPFTVRDLGEVAIRCRDLAAMTAFYSDIIGLEMIEGDYRDTIVFLRVGDGFAGHTSVVALFTAEDDETEPEDGPEGGDTSSLHHLAFTVKAEDLAPALSWYKAHGIEPWTAEHRWVGWDSVYVKDPEGNTVELVASVRQSSGSGEPPAKDT